MYVYACATTDVGCLGGYPKIVREGINDNYLLVWMQQAGYNTYYTGKMRNAHTVDNWIAPSNHGFNGFDFLLHPHTYEYYNATMTPNNQPPLSYEGKYSPDVVAEKASALLHEATTHSDPWVLTVATIAPHSDVDLSLGAYDRFATDFPESAPDTHIYSQLTKFTERTTLIPKKQVISLSDCSRLCCKDNM